MYVVKIRCSSSLERLSKSDGNEIQAACKIQRLLAGHKSLPIQFTCGMSVHILNNNSNFFSGVLKLCFVPFAVFCETPLLL